MENQDCIFCGVYQEGSRTVFETDSFFVMLDNFPVSKGHSLIIPKRHQIDVFDLTEAEGKDLTHAVRKTKSHLDDMFRPDGYNIGINAGEVAGQTVFHLHIHVIPRYKGDVENPRGGIRNFKKPLMEY